MKKNKRRYLSLPMRLRESDNKGRIKISRKIMRVLRTMNNRDKKRREKDKQRFSHVDYVGLGIADRAWDRQCRNAMLIEGLVEPDFSASLIERMDRPGKIKRLRELLRELPPKQKRRLLLRFYAQKSYAEIAEIEGITVSTVHKSITVAKRYIMDNF